MRFAGPVPFSLPTQNINSKSGKFLEFFRVLDLSRNLLPNNSESFVLTIFKSPSTPGFLSSLAASIGSPCEPLDTSLANCHRQK